MNINFLIELLSVLFDLADAVPQLLAGDWLPMASAVADLLRFVIDPARRFLHGLVVPDRGRHAPGRHRRLS